MTRPRDTQRQAVYDWEQRAGLLVLKPAQTLSLLECQALIDRCWQGYRRPIKAYSAPAVTSGKGRRRGCYSPSAHVIKLPIWTRQPAYVVHEVAHAIVETGYRKTAWHGPEFVRVYCELLVAFLGKTPLHLMGQMLTGKRNVKCSSLMGLPWRGVSSNQTI